MAPLITRAEALLLGEIADHIEIEALAERARRFKRKTTVPAAGRDAKHVAGGHGRPKGSAQREARPRQAV